MINKTVFSDKVRDQIANFILTAIRLLLDEADDVQVRYLVGENTTIFHVEIEQKNLGIVIGSRGKHIESLRTLVKSIAGRNNIRAVIEIPYFVKSAK